ncbi:unnamed protein product [Rotaria sordida]|uniref:Dynein light chain Tctex-type 1 n=1 Tax=Rotaria sordida TaxID=392033 RepID=A0A815TAD1_9BILA|nr:unnamed protein product [Rotaria sordida]CAF1447668.1 unnamed protein product [Rotaria sordida]CAF1455725.1 unnamed protein product [Rotaria sordida]CAF1491901.1 unnamed protein product [Rotaria sordida]CAF1498460.1 unnamed protein product [Rotaria sordida]
MDRTYGRGFLDYEVSNIIQDSIVGTLIYQTYEKTKVNLWTSNIVETILNSLARLNKPYKYIVFCVIMEKTGAGLHTASSCLWDETSDRSCTLRWENETMFVTVTVFGLSN